MSSTTQRKKVGPKKLPKNIKCELCKMDFVDCEYPNLPTQNPCGCHFHEYCLYKYGGSQPMCPGSSCRRNNGSTCKSCKDMQSEIKQLTTENTKLKKKVEQLSSKSNDADDLRKRNKQLTSEISKWQKKVEHLTKILSK